MLGTELARAVARFADVTHGLPNAALDRAWAWGAYDSEGVRFAFFRTYEELRELAVRASAARAEQGPRASSAQRILGQYHSAYRDLQAVLLGIGEDVENQPPSEGEWSLRQVAAHIAGADVGFFVLVRYALDRHRSGDGRPAEIPDEAWEAILGEDLASLDKVLDGPLVGVLTYHQALHERVLREFADIGEEELSFPSMYWEGYALSLRFRLHRFESHLRQHTVQIEKTLDALGRSPGEAKRLLRLIYAALADAEAATIGAQEVAVEAGREVAAAIAARAEEIAGIVA